MNASAKLAWSLLGVVALIAALALLHDGSSIYQTAVILVVFIGIAGLGIF